MIGIDTCTDIFSPGSKGLFQEYTLHHQTGRPEGSAPGALAKNSVDTLTLPKKHPELQQAPKFGMSLYNTL